MLAPHLLSLPTHGSANSGWLAVTEGSHLPFPVRRVYWIFGVPPGYRRGRHTHRTLEQLLVAVNGEIKITVESSTNERHIFMLTHPSQALYMPPGSWREIEFGPGAVLLSLASQEYDENDYLRK
jgi:quercetin dioxygenase-like cupin family protein